MSGQRTHKRKSGKFDYPFCIYCGGAEPYAETDHNPPRAIFSGKLRPKDWEFPSCSACNRGAATAELIAAAMSRIFGGGGEPSDMEEFSSLLGAIDRDVPGLLRSIEMPRAATKLRSRSLSIPEGGGPLRWNDWLESYMQLFAAKIGFAAHFLAFGKAVPVGGGVVARLYSNADVMLGNFPSVIAELFPDRHTLSQGKWSVEDQFQYCVQQTVDGEMSAAFASFREAFAVVTFSADDTKKLKCSVSARERIFLPGELKRGVKARFGGHSGFRVTISPRW